MQSLLLKLRKDYPKLKFTPGKMFYWSPETQEIFYKSGARGKQATWSLLHETGHAILGHTSYKADYELLQLEIAAWTKAQEIAGKYDIQIDEDHVQDCLDTYRYWLHKRSICPTCSANSLQQDDHKHYRCYNCHTVWQVSASRFCRAYRSTKKLAAEPLLEVSGL